MDIARKAYVEQQILGLASEKNLLQPAIEEIAKKYSIAPSLLRKGLFPETRILSLIYLLIVVPKEFHTFNKSHEIYNRIETSWFYENIEVKLNTRYKDNPVYAFIHHLRNAMAHTNFEFKDNSEKIKFEFWDKDTRTQHEVYRATLSFETICDFLERVGAIFANQQ